jgi:hypothetical protein
LTGLGPLLLNGCEENGGGPADGFAEAGQGANHAAGARYINGGAQDQQAIRGSRQRAEQAAQGQADSRADYYPGQGACDDSSHANSCLWSEAVCSPGF